MAIQERRNDVVMPGGAMRRFLRTRPVLVIAAVLFAGLVQFAGLAPIPAVIGFAVIALAVLIREAALPGTDDASIYGERTGPLIADRMVDAIIAGLSDPALALAPDSQVVAFNASAQQILPGISRGEPISFALRVPNVLEAIRAVAASRQSQRVEFFERVPSDRWWEAAYRAAAAARRDAEPGAQSRVADAARSHAVAPRRGDARRLRRQCEPRAAHAARLAVGLHRDAAGPGAQTMRRPATASSPS